MILNEQEQVKELFKNKDGRVFYDDELKYKFLVKGGRYLLDINLHPITTRTIEDLNDIVFEFYSNKNTKRTFGSQKMFKNFKNTANITKILEETDFFITPKKYGKSRGDEALKLRKELEDAGLPCKNGAKYFDIAHMEDLFKVVYPKDKTDLKFRLFMELIQPFLLYKVEQKPIGIRNNNNNNDNNNTKKNKRNREEEEEEDVSKITTEEIKMFHKKIGKWIELQEKKEKN